MRAPSASIPWGAAALCSARRPLRRARREGPQLVTSEPRGAGSEAGSHATRNVPGVPIPPAQHRTAGMASGGAPVRYKAPARTTSRSSLPSLLTRLLPPIKVSSIKATTMNTNLVLLKRATPGVNSLLHQSHGSDRTPAASRPRANDSQLGRQSLGSDPFSLRMHVSSPSQSPSPSPCLRVSVSPCLRVLVSSRLVSSRLVSVNVVASPGCGHGDRGGRPRAPTSCGSASSLPPSAGGR